MSNPFTQPTVAVDMDHVMADTGGYLCGWLNARYGTDYRDESFGTLRRTLPEAQKRALMDVVTEGSILAELPVMEGCAEAMRALAERFDLVICTAAMEYPATIPHKIGWLREHFGWMDEKSFVFCGHKQVMGTDYLLDDSAHHFRGFAGQGVLYTAPHNRDVDGYPRVDDWSAVLRYFADQPSEQ